MQKSEMNREISRYTTVSPIMAIRLCCWSEARLQRVIHNLKAINEVYNGTNHNQIKAFNRNT